MKRNYDASTILLLMLAGRAVDAAGAVGGGAAPDALVIDYDRIGSNILRDRDTVKNPPLLTYRLYFSLKTCVKLYNKHPFLASDFDRNCDTNREPDDIRRCRLYPIHASHPYRP